MFFALRNKLTLGIDKQASLCAHLLVYFPLVEAFWLLAPGIFTIHPYTAGYSVVRQVWQVARCRNTHFGTKCGRLPTACHAAKRSGRLPSAQSRRNFVSENHGREKSYSQGNSKRKSRCSRTRTSHTMAERKLFYYSMKKQLDYCSLLAKAIISRI